MRGKRTGCSQLRGQRRINGRGGERKEEQSTRKHNNQRVRSAASRASGAQKDAKCEQHSSEPETAGIRHVFVVGLDGVTGYGK